MNISKEEKEQYLKAKDQVHRIRIFYLHLALYIIVVALISYNFYILEEGPYKANITALNISVLVLWTIVIIIHGWKVFKGRFIFKKSWEDRKLKEILEKDFEDQKFYE